MFIGPCNIVIAEELKTNLMSLVVFISIIFAHHVSNINMSIFSSLRLWWWITTSVILFSVRCVLGFAAGDAWWCPTLLKPLKHPSLLTPYVHFFIQSFHKAGNLISKQHPGEPNPLLQMAINPSHPPTWPCQSNSNLHSAYSLHPSSTQP